MCSAFQAPAKGLTTTEEAPRQMVACAPRCVVVTENLPVLESDSRDDLILLGQCILANSLLTAFIPITVKVGCTGEIVKVYRRFPAGLRWQAESAPE